jgi:uncharacterized phage protein (predicted DNA packaging)
MSDNFTAFSTISVDDVIEYLRISAEDLDESQRSLLGTMLEAAKNYVLHYTGRLLEYADSVPEFTIAVYAICSDMYDKRTYQVDEKSSNKIVDSILDSRSVNLL